MGNEPAQGALRPVGDPQQPGRVGRIGPQGAAVLLHRQGGQGVGGLTGLGDPDRQRVWSEGRRRVAELAGIEDIGGDTGQLLEQVSTHHRGVTAGAAGQDLNPLDALINVLIEGQGHEAMAAGRGRRGFRQVPGHPEGRRFRLLVNLLEHEVTEAALVRHVLGAAQQGRGALYPDARLVVELDPEGGEERHLAVFHRQDRAREAGQGRRIAGAEKFAFTEADQKRRLMPGHHQGAGRLRPDHRQGIGPMQLRQHLLHSLQQQRRPALTPAGLEGHQGARQQMGDHLGVRLGAEDDTLGLEAFPQGAVVLDDAVLHHRHL